MRTLVAPALALGVGHASRHSNEQERDEPHVQQTNVGGQGGHFQRTTRKPGKKVRRRTCGSREVKSDRPHSSFRFRPREECDPRSVRSFTLPSQTSHSKLPPCRRARSSGCSTRRRRRCWRAWSASRSAAEHKPRSSRRALFVLTPRCPPPPERRQQRRARRLAAVVRRRLARALMGHRARRLDTVLPPCSPARIHLTAHRTVHDRRRRRRLARLWPRRVPRGCGR